MGWMTLGVYEVFALSSKSNPIAYKLECHPLKADAFQSTPPSNFPGPRSQQPSPSLPSCKACTRELRELAYQERIKKTSHQSRRTHWSWSGAGWNHEWES